MKGSRESVRWGGEKRNAKKPSYSTPSMGLRATPKTWKTRQKPPRGKGEGGQWKPGECTGACSGMLSHSLSVGTRIRARVGEKFFTRNRIICQFFRKLGILLL